MELLLPAPAVQEPPAEWAWCPDCAGTGRLLADPATGAPPLLDDDCWTCRGLGACTEIL